LVLLEDRSLITAMAGGGDPTFLLRKAQHGKGQVPDFQRGWGRRRSRDG
jgi:hypothetical protein